MNCNNDIDKNESSYTQDHADKMTIGSFNTDSRKAPDDIGEQYHPLSQITITDALSDCFKARWIDNVEQAVGCLAVIKSEIDGKEEFLAQAKEILGEEIFLKYMTPAQTHPLGCFVPKEEA